MPPKISNEAVKAKEQWFRSGPNVYDQLSFELQTYPFESDRLLLNGFKFGFSLNYTDPRMYREARILKSAREAPGLVEKKIT